MTDSTDPKRAAFYEAVGRVVVSAAELEYGLTMLLMGVIGSGNATVILQGQPITLVLENLATAANAIPTTVPASDISALVARSRSLINDRDQVVHSIWSGRLDAAERTSFLMRTRKDPTVKAFTNAQLVELHTQLATCANLALDYFYAMGETRP